MYSAEAMEHFMNPQNAGTLDPANGRGEAANNACGDTVVITVMVTDDVVVGAKFASSACAGGIAACSAVTEWAHGKERAAVAALDAETVSALLGGLPEAKAGCSVMALTALQQAVEQAP